MFHFIRRRHQSIKQQYDVAPLRRELTFVFENTWLYKRGVWVRTLGRKVANETWQTMCRCESHPPFLWCGWTRVSLSLSLSPRRAEPSRHHSKQNNNKETNAKNNSTAYVCLFIYLFICLLACLVSFFLSIRFIALTHTSSKNKRQNKKPFRFLQSIIITIIDLRTNGTNARISDSCMLARDVPRWPSVCADTAISSCSSSTATITFTECSAKHCLSFETSRPFGRVYGSTYD